MALKIRLHTVRLMMRTAAAALMLVCLAAPLRAQNGPARRTVPVESSRQERLEILEGNKAYNNKSYAEAETHYKKALEINPGSEVARYNLANTYLRQASGAPEDKLRQQAEAMLTDIAQLAENLDLAERAWFNLGNMSYNAQQYQPAIDRYKEALRINPDDDKARDNLRLAQLKLREQQNQDQNQDKNQDKKDQDQQNQDQQDQDKQDQNQNQNQQNKQQDQNQNQDQQQNQNQQQDKDKQKPEQQQGGISDQNAQQILKAMENAEAATRKRVEAERKKGQATRRKPVINPW